MCDDFEEGTDMVENQRFKYTTLSYETYDDIYKFINLVTPGRILKKVYKTL